MKPILFALLFVFSSLNLFSQCSCDEALRKDVLKTENSLYIQTKFLESITESEYSEIKVNGSAGVDIPVLKGIIGASASYDDFRKRIRQYSKKIDSESTLINNASYSYARTSPVAYDAWSKCMSDCINRPGVYLIKSFDAEDYGTFKVKYIPAPGESDQIFCKFTIASADTVYYLNSIVLKNGNAEITYARKFKNNASTTLVTVNASQELNGSISYSDRFSSLYLKPSGIRVLALNYSYVVRETRAERGPTIRCPMWGQNIFQLSTQMVNMSPSCDNKWGGFTVVVMVTPSPGFKFTEGINYDNLKLEGPMAAWNWGQRCPGEKHDAFLSGTDSLKQMRVWLHKEVDAHLEAISYKDNTITETAFASVSAAGQISFTVPGDRLNQYHIDITLSTGARIVITPDNVNEIAFTNIDSETKAVTFTLKDLMSM